MSPVRPRGPLPARVYWTRRLVVLGVPLLLVVVLARVLGAGSDARDTPTASQASAPTTTAAAPSAGPSAPAPEPTTGKKKKRKKDKPAEPVLAEPTGPCVDSDVVVTPSVPEAITADGLRIDLELRTRTTPACTWTVSPDSVIVNITSGPDDIWSSQHCPTALPRVDVVVRQAVGEVVSFTWNLRRSDPECSELTDWVRLGWYHATAAALGGEPTDVQFELARPPAEVVTKTVTPEPRPKKKADQGRTHEAGDSGEGVSEPNG